MTKEHRIYFRCDSKMLRQLDELSSKLGVNRAEAIRFSLDKAIAEHMHSGHRGAITAINTKLLDNILMALHNRIEELDPQAQIKTRAKKGIEAGKKAHELYRQGKKKEAKKLVKESIDKGIVPVYFEWEKP